MPLLSYHLQQHILREEYIVLPVEIHPHRHTKFIAVNLSGQKQNHQVEID